MLYIATYGDDYEPQVIHGVFSSRAAAELSLEDVAARTRAERHGYTWDLMEITEAELDTPIGKNVPPSGV